MSFTELLDGFELEKSGSRISCRFKPPEEVEVSIDGETRILVSLDMFREFCARGLELTARDLSSTIPAAPPVPRFEERDENE